jgi:hypothetical protein
MKVLSQCLTALCKAAKVCADMRLGPAMADAAAASDLLSDDRLSLRGRNRRDVDMMLTMLLMMLMMATAEESSKPQHKEERTRRDARRKQN